MELPLQPLQPIANSQIIDKLPFDLDDNKICSLIYYDGDLQSLYKKDKTYYIIKWRDNDATSHRWLCYSFPESQIFDFANCKVTYYDIIQKSDFICIMDIQTFDPDNPKAEIWNYTYYKVKTEDIPDYLPNKTTTYVADLQSVDFTKYIESLKQF